MSTNSAYTFLVDNNKTKHPRKGLQDPSYELKFYF